MDPLFQRIEAKRDELVALTRDMVRIPTVNPPGEAYRDLAELVAGAWCRAFEAVFVRGAGAPGDSDRYPRWNVVCRRDGGGQVLVSISTAISTWSSPATVGPWSPSAPRFATAGSTAAAPAT